MASNRHAVGGDFWTTSPRRGRSTPTAITIAVGIHVAVVAGLSSVDTSRLSRREAIVEMEVQERKPPPPEIRPTPPPPPAPEPAPQPKPRIVPRRVAVAPKVPAPQPPAPPPPNQEPPKTATKAPPVFGVTLSSEVSGDKAAMAVPVGNTVMTKDRTPGRPGETPQAYSAEGTHPFTPVADIYITQQPRVLHEVDSADIYPPEARKMGVEGKVALKVGIDENGDVRQVRVISKAGYGFDEAARDAMRRFKFSPARTSDGKAVAYNFTYTVRFTLDGSH